jgi:cyclopropane fatty-acyl-phospholipid synthase-like methyltransferase
LSSAEPEFTFDDAYKGTPPWDIGRPQKEFTRIAKEEFKGKILDSGCGTGENSLYFASLGFQVVGADFSKRAVEKARGKAMARGLKAKVTFVVSDALNPSDELKREEPFDTIVDCGLYHAFEGSDTDKYIENIRKLLKPGGTFFMMCFSDLQEGEWGPRRVPKSEIEQKFSVGWTINYIKDALFENNDPKLTPPSGARAWLASVSKSSS